MPPRSANACPAGESRSTTEMDKGNSADSCCRISRASSQKPQPSWVKRVISTLHQGCFSPCCNWASKVATFTYMV